MYTLKILQIGNYFENTTLENIVAWNCIMFYLQVCLLKVNCLFSSCEGLNKIQADPNVVFLQFARQIYTEEDK